MRAPRDLATSYGSVAFIHGGLQIAVSQEGGVDILDARTGLSAGSVLVPESLRTRPSPYPAQSVPGSVRTRLSPYPAWT